MCQPPANEAVSFTVSTRMTLQKVVHRKGQDHIDKLKQLGEILTSKQHNRGEDEIDVSPPDVHPSPEQASSYTPSHSPHGQIQHLKSMSDIYFIGKFCLFH